MIFNYLRIRNLSNYILDILFVFLGVLIGSGVSVGVQFVNKIFYKKIITNSFGSLYFRMIIMVGSYSKS